MGRVYYNSPIGVLEIITNNDLLTNINLVNQTKKNDPDDLTVEVQNQLAFYFDGKLKVFDLPIELHGTAFCRLVWQNMQRIPYGKTVTYGELAAMAGSPKAYRSAGSCVGKNPIPIILPCHRVIASNGLGGFRLGLDIKKFLLNLESN